VAAWTPVGMSVVTSLRPAIRELLAGPAPRPRAAPGKMARPPRVSGAALDGSYLCQQLAALRPRDSIIVEEAPTTRGPMHDYLPILARDTFYTCASGGLGYGLPAAIGVALARRNEKVIALLGDGASMYAIQGLWTAAQLKLPITFIIVNNRRYEALVQFAQHFGLPRTVGTTLADIDFCGLALSQGCKAVRVDRAEGLDAALRGALAAAEPTLVEAVVES